MKSIKEKAEEIFPIEESDSFETELKRLKMRQCYEHGANYVLEQVEMLLNSQRFVDNPSEELFELIEQLKK